MSSSGRRASRELNMEPDLQISQAVAHGPTSSAQSVDMAKMWSAHRCVSTAKKLYGLGSGAISTLRALISFLREGGASIVFASNVTICNRAENQSERNLRRHIAQLAKAGLIRRRDSPNGKRYMIQHPDGPVEAFGLDLSPLLSRQEELKEAAAAVNRELHLIKFLRRRMSSLLYHAGLLGHFHLVEEYQSARRRKLASSDLQAICDKLQAVLDQGSVLEQQEAPAKPQEILTGNDGQSVRHKINTEYKVKDIDCAAQAESGTPTEADLLRRIQAACPEALSYAARNPSNMWEVEEHALTLGTWCGISRELLTTAVARAGRKKVAVAILGLFERKDRIRNLPAYFNSLILGRRAAGFDPIRLLS